ncbi:MAG: hypothetical protein HC849_12745 [Oscillatoriales cyanobacterium RU_3_3]|nr:hypothetical protein [Oscillatoriales cyanobacterium RU_3_3]
MTYCSQLDLATAGFGNSRLLRIESEVFKIFRSQPCSKKFSIDSYQLSTVNCQLSTRN